MGFGPVHTDWHYLTVTNSLSTHNDITVMHMELSAENYSYCFGKTL